jgi:hypothetical protein
MAIGKEESETITRAGLAARAKKASEILLHTAVASVPKPVGLRIKVAGSAFIEVKKTGPNPANIPGRSNK